MTAEKIVAGALKVGRDVIVADGPGGMGNVISAIEINGIVRHTATAPNSGRAAYLTARAFDHGSMKLGVKVASTLRQK